MLPALETLRTTLLQALNLGGDTVAHYPANYLPPAVFLAVAIAFCLGSLAFSFLVRPNRPSAAKGSAYECGSPAEGTARDRPHVRYALAAMIFVLFDVEVAFLFPWAVAYRGLGLSGLISMGVFIGLLLIGYWYLVRKGVFAWR